MPGGRQGQVDHPGQGVGAALPSIARIRAVHRRRCGCGQGIQGRVQFGAGFGIEAATQPPPPGIGPVEVDFPAGEHAGLFGRQGVGAVGVQDVEQVRADPRQPSRIMGPGVGEQVLLGGVDGGLVDPGRHLIQHRGDDPGRLLRHLTRGQLLQRLGIAPGQRLRQGHRHPRLPGTLPAVPAQPPRRRRRPHPQRRTTGVDLGDRP
jgi:hypothetical protein